MLYKIIFDVISAWQVIAVGLAVMIILPVVFYFASFDKKPVKIRRVPQRRTRTRAPVKRAPAMDPGEGDMIE